jgi:hypothetical protein
MEFFVDRLVVIGLDFGQREAIVRQRFQPNLLILAGHRTSSGLVDPERGLLELGRCVSEMLRY